MKHLLLALALVAAFFVPQPAAAQGIPTPIACPATGGGPIGGNLFICTVDAQGKLHVVVDPGGLVPSGFKVAYITASGNTVIKSSGPGNFFELINLSTSAQSTTCTWYDNGATNTGNIMYSENSIGPSQIILMNSNFGLPLTFGLTVNCGGLQTVGLLVVYL